MSDYVPSIQDLRVKLCYICREEELFDSANFLLLCYCII